MASGLLSVEEGLKRALEPIKFVGSERVDLLTALGRVIAEDIKAPADVPAFANSAMDGYAVRAADTATASKESPAVLTVIEDLPAGYIAKSSVGPGQAIRIMTGAPLPDGADSDVLSDGCVRVMTLQDGNAEFTGIQFLGDGQSFLIHLQHRTQDGRAVPHTTDELLVSGLKIRDH